VNGLSSETRTEAPTWWNRLHWSTCFGWSPGRSREDPGDQNQSWFLATRCTLGEDPTDSPAIILEHKAPVWVQLRALVGPVHPADLIDILENPFSLLLPWVSSQRVRILFQFPNAWDKLAGHVPPSSCARSLGPFLFIGCRFQQLPPGRPVPRLKCGEEEDHDPGQPGGAQSARVHIRPGCGGYRTSGDRRSGQSLVSCFSSEGWQRLS
jgi:hypothetical protein